MKIEENTVYIIPNIFRQALEENWFDYSKIIRKFKNCNYVETILDVKGYINRKHNTMFELDSFYIVSRAC